MLKGVHLLSIPTLIPEVLRTGKYQRLINGTLKFIHMTLNRRKFISAVAISGAALPFKSGFDPFVAKSSEYKFPVRLFSKALDKYDFDFMCECIAKSGIGGIDLTVRQGGRVEPENVATELPKLVRQAKKYDLVTDMMVTGIVSVADPYAEQVLKTAFESGIKYYRLGWLDYDHRIGIWESLQKFRSALKEIADLNRKYKILGGYQNHAGQMIGSPVWDLHELLPDLPAEFLGVQYDVRHAMVEGANSWIIGLQLMAAHITSLAVKDFTWINVKGKPQAVTVPLGEGMVDWDLFFKTLKELNISAPVTLHIEYPLLDNGEEKLTLLKQQEIIVLKLRKDMDFLNSYLNKYKLK
jgi:L-ribulose-5-phosphate 3-epimerase